MGLDVFIHHDLHAAGLKARWTGLLDAMPHASIFNTWEWCASWADTVGSDTQPAVIEVCDAGCTIGLAPLALRTTRTGRWLEFLGRRRVAGDHLDLLALPERREEVISAILRTLDEGPVDFDGVELGDLNYSSPTLGIVRDWCEVREHSIVNREHRVVPYISLPQSFDAYLAGRSPNMRYHIRRRRRSAVRTGRWVELIRGGDGLDQALDAYFELHARRWDEKGGGGNFQNAEMARFLRSFCAMAAAHDWLRCYCLIAEDRVEGVLIAFHYRETASFYQISWDPEQSNASPGVLLLAASIEQAIAEGLPTYDFLQGDEEYKKRWTDEVCEQITMMIGCRGAARVAVVAERLKEAVKTSALRLVSRSVLDSASCE